MKMIAIIFLLNAIEAQTSTKRHTNKDIQTMMKSKQHKINVVFVNFCILMKIEHSKTNIIIYCTSVDEKNVFLTQELLFFDIVVYFSKKQTQTNNTPTHTHTHTLNTQK